MLKRSFGFLLLKLKNHSLTFGLAVMVFFMGWLVGWRKALRWAAMKYELKQAKEGLRNVEMRKKIERSIDQLDDDELDHLLLSPDKPRK